MKLKRSLISLILVLCMIIQPFVPVFADGNGKDSETSGNVSDAKAQFQEAYDQIMELEEIELGWGAKAAVGVAGFFEGENYLEQVKNANEQIREARENAEQMKKDFDSGKMDEAEKADPKALAQGALTAQTETQAQLQETLNKCGETLVKIADVLDTIATIVAILTPIAEICLAFPPATAAAGVVLSICDVLNTVLPPAAIALRGIGQGLIDTAQTGQFSDRVLVGNVVWDTGVEFVKDKAMDALGGVAGDALGGMWDMSGSITKDLVQADLGDDLTKLVTNNDSYRNMMYKRLEDGVAKNTDNVVDKLTDDVAGAIGGAMDLSGNSIEVNDGQKVTGDLLDKGFDLIKPAYLKGDGASLSAE